MKINFLYILLLIFSFKPAHGIITVKVYYNIICLKIIKNTRMSSLKILLLVFSPV